MDQDQNLVSLLSKSKARISQLPGEVSGLSNTLGDLQEVRDNSRGLVEETYQSYRAVLEQAKNAALLELEERHNQRELAIMEKLENYDITESSLEQAIAYTDQLVSICPAGEQQQLEQQVVGRLRSLLEQLDKRPAGLQTSLAWVSDKESFNRAVMGNFGKFSNPVVITSIPPVSLVVSEAVSPGPAGGQAALVQALLSPAPPLGQVTMTPSPGLLSLGPLSPLSSANPSQSLCSPHGAPPSPRAGHGPIGSSVSSPSHHYSLPPRSHLGLSHPDLSLSSPRLSLGMPHHTPPLPLNTNVEYNLAQLANISMERSTSGPINSNPSFSLADLISNVEDDTAVSPLTPGWDPSEPSPHPPHHQHQALNNLAALAKL